MTWQPISGIKMGQRLRARRAHPADVGLPVYHGRRGTPGLRREELATLAGISSDCYVRLERGRETRPSPVVVDAHATALQLTEDEREHLRSLAALAARPTLRPADTQGRGCITFSGRVLGNLFMLAGVSPQEMAPVLGRY
jgi:transcriptional regulator with XRE-family HTH domain